MPEKHEEKRQTVPGYAGPTEKAVAPPKDLPEGAVVGQGGSVTLPTIVTVAAPSFKEPSGADLMVGRALLEGDTFNGYHRKIIVELTQGVTEEGAFNVFRGHYPDAIFDGFKAKNVTEEEAKKLVEEWGKEHDGTKPKKG